ncbi:uncharacterized protein LOC141628330 [Silene latifolia]|uniref:uncharacterized protein LOC141628330 n=1 Tax=Silene latifolia TaxID=37657 RepID=UPI003D774619
MGHRAFECRSAPRGSNENRNQEGYRTPAPSIEGNRYPGQWSTQRSYNNRQGNGGNQSNGGKTFGTASTVQGNGEKGKPIVLYIAVQEHSLGAMCAQEIDDCKERALYYLSRTLVGVELNYSPIEKICLALVFAIQKLRHYMKYDLVFVPQKAVKGQAIADFFADHPMRQQSGKIQMTFQEKKSSTRTFSLHGRCTLMVLQGKMELELELIPSSHTWSPNGNEIGVRDMDIYGDSKLVVNQVLDEFEVKMEDLIPYHRRALQLLNQLDSIKIGHVPRSANKLDDALAYLAATFALGAEESMQVPVYNRWVVSLLEEEENVDTTNIICVYTADEDVCRQPIIDFLDHQKLPDDLRYKVKIRRRAPKFIHYKGTLYRRSFLGQWLRCLSKDEAAEAMNEAHSGICGAHQSWPKLHDRVKRMGYYWPTMVQDCMDFAKKCDPCQFYANFIHQPPEPLQPTVSSWPFEAWGLDVVGPITPKALNGHEYILASTDYFSEWAEALPL